MKWHFQTNTFTVHQVHTTHTRNSPHLHYTSLQEIKHFLLLMVQDVRLVTQRVSAYYEWEPLSLWTTVSLTALLKYYISCHFIFKTLLLPHIWYQPHKGTNIYLWLGIYRYICTQTGIIFTISKFMCHVFVKEKFSCSRNLHILCVVVLFIAIIQDDTSTNKMWSSTIRVRLMTTSFQQLHEQQSQRLFVRALQMWPYLGIFHTLPNKPGSCKQT